MCVHIKRVKDLLSLKDYCKFCAGEGLVSNNIYGVTISGFKEELNYMKKIMH